MIFCNIYRERERDHTHKSFRFVSIWMCALLQWDIFSATQLSLSRRPLCQCWRICSCKWTSVAVSTHFITPRFLIRMGIFGPSFLNGSTKVPHFLGEGKMKPWSPTTPPPKQTKGGRQKLTKIYRLWKGKISLETIKPYFAKSGEFIFQKCC